MSVRQPARALPLSYDNLRSSRVPRTGCLIHETEQYLANACYDVDDQKVRSRTVSSVLDGVSSEVERLHDRYVFPGDQADAGHAIENTRSRLNVPVSKGWHFPERVADGEPLVPPHPAFGHLLPDGEKGYPLDFAGVNGASRI